MDYEVRCATGADLTRLRECYLRSWRAAYDGFLAQHVLDDEAAKRGDFDWSRGIAAGSTTVLVAVTSEGRVLGVVQAEEDLPPPRDQPEITMLYVDPEAWGSPVAAELLHAAESWLASRNHSSARLRVVEAHGRARRFYEREGWSPDPTLEPAHNGFFELLYYRRPIGG